MKESKAIFKPAVGTDKRWSIKDVQTISNYFLQTLTKETVATEVGSMFLYLASLAKKANRFIWAHLGFCSAS